MDRRVAPGSDDGPDTALDELLKLPPVSEPNATVERDGERVMITIAGRPKPRLPSGLVTALIVFIASAFVCPGVFVVAAILLPIGLLILGGIYLFSPEILERPVDTQKIVFSPEEIRFYESCPREFDPDSDDFGDPTAVIDTAEEPASAELITGDVDDLPAIRITGLDDNSFDFGSSLIREIDGDEREEKAADQRELEWLFKVVETNLKQTH